MKAIAPNLTTKPPMLAKNWDNTMRPDGWWMSEKLDGVRAIWDGEHFRSRGGNIFHAPAWFKAGLPALQLDGELFVGRGKFNDTVSIVRSMTADWSPVRYLVFDVQADCPTEDRQRTLLALQLPGHVSIVEQVLCQSENALLDFERSILNGKGEGVMLRAPRSPYEFKRSGHLRKLKRFIDDEATVIGHRDRPPGRRRQTRGTARGAGLPTQGRHHVPRRVRFHRRRKGNPTGHRLHRHRSLLRTDARRRATLPDLHRHPQLRITKPHTTMDIEYIKHHRRLTLELGRGETYRSNKPTLYGHSTYGRSSVLAGRPRRVFLESWDDLDTARAELKAAKIRYADLCETGGSTHIPVDIITAGIPDEDI